MKLLIQQAVIISSSSPFDGKRKDILIENGAISKIEDHLQVDSSFEVIRSENLHVSIGWIDSFANFCDPGNEGQETLESGSKAAAAGGFTHVMLMPNTKPAADNKSQIEYLQQKNAHSPVSIHPIGAVSKNIEGKELAEMYDMRHAGAVAFGDGNAPIQNSGLVLKALQYVKAFNGVVMQIPEDKSISNNGLMNEGVISTRLGLPGIPALAEEIFIQRDLKLAAYANSRIHFTGVSTSNGIKYIQEAKANGIQVTCSVTPFHLYFSDEDLQEYDTNLKVNPPLRSTADRAALRQAFLNGTIDCLASHHLPYLNDHKKCEFEYAKAGMAAIQNTFSAVNTLFENTSDLNRIIESITTAPRKIFGLTLPEIREGATACLTLFDPTEKYIPKESDMLSKSKNNAFIGKKLVGSPIGIVHKNQLVFSS